MFNPLHFCGVSGKVYKFYIYRLPHAFTENKGTVFFLSRYIVADFYVPLYLDATSDLRKYLNGSFIQEKICEDTATHICVYTEDDETKRQFALKDLSNFIV